jgi:uncharacterized coiled-coil protein SlyX
MVDIESLTFIFGTILAILGIVMAFQRSCAANLSKAIASLEQAIKRLTEKVGALDVRTSVEIAKINERCAHHVPHR